MKSDLATVRKIAEQIDQYEKDYKALYRQLDELVRKHPHKWAGMYKGKLTIADSLDELVEKLGKASPDTAAAYLTPSPRKIILRIERAR